MWFDEGGLVDFFDLLVFWLWCLVGEYKVFDVEVVVVGFVVEVVVVCGEFGVVRCGFGEILVNLFLDEVVEYVWVLVDFVLVFFEIVESVVYGVGEFVGEDGVVVGGVGGDFEEVFLVGVFGGFDVGVGFEVWFYYVWVEVVDDVDGFGVGGFVLGVFVVNWMCGVEVVELGGDGGKVWVVVGFVVYGLYDDGWVVFVVFGYVDGVVEEGVVLVWIGGEFVVDVVGFDVGFVDDVEVVVVIKFILVWVVGIV